MVTTATTKTDEVFFSKKEEKSKKHGKREKVIKVRQKDEIIREIDFDSSQDIEFVKSEGKHDIDKTVFGDVMRVELNPKQERTKVKYYVSQDVNKRLLITLNILEEVIPYIKDMGLGCSRSEYEKNIVKPLKKFVSTGRVRTRKSKVKGINDNDTETVKLSSFQLPRKVKNEFDELYNRLKEEGNDMSVIFYEDNSVSLLHSAKTIRMYLNTHELKDESTKRIILDNFLNKLFEGKISELYTKNKGDFITQRQVQTLASWFVSK